MGVKVVLVNGHWSIRVNYNRLRITRQVTPDTEARAIEVAERLRTALEMFGRAALRVYTDEKPEEPKAVPTVAEYAAQWTAELDRTALKRSTRESYQYLIRVHVIPELGDTKLDKLTYSILKAWVHAKRKTHSGNTVRLMVAAVRALCKEACHDGHITANPVHDLGRFYTTAKTPEEKADPFTLDELHAVEAKVRERFCEHYGFVLAMSRTGMRIGEASALQWRDFDERHSQVLVRRNLPHHREATTPKTTSSERKVDLSPDLLEELVRIRRERKAQLLKRGEEWRDDGWIFETSEHTPIHYNNFVRRVWDRAQDLAGVRRRKVHDLRHTWASQMLAAGADPAYVAAQLGHSSPAVTLEIYAHWIPGTARVTAAVLDGETQINANGGGRQERERARRR